MNWLLLTAISVVFRAIYGVMSKVLSTKLEVTSYTKGFLLPFAGVVVAVITSPLLGGIHFSTKISLLTVLLVIVGQGLGNIFYFASIKSLTNSTAQITFSSILIFNTTLALVFLHLHLSVLNVAGLMLLMLAIVSVTTGKVEFNRRGVVLMLSAALLFAVFQLSSGELSKQVSAAAYLIIAYGGAAAVVFALKFKQIIYDIRSVTNKASLAKIPLLTAVPSIGNFLFAYYAYKSAPSSAKVAMLLTAQVVVTVFLSYLFLKEKDHVWRKVAASILVVASAVMIKN